MGIKAKSRIEVEEAWKAVEGEAQGARPKVKARNLGPTLWLADPMRMPFRGLMYEIPPIRYSAGVEATNIQKGIIEAVGRDDLQAYQELLKEATELIRANVRPYRWKRWGHRLRWALGWNPFKEASEFEIGEFLAGFQMRRTMRPEFK
jgi:hypothetical protein